MIVAIVTFHFAHPTTLGEISKVFQGAAPKYQGMPGLLRKNYIIGSAKMADVPGHLRVGLLRGC
jgi:hypothetical protein